MKLWTVPFTYGRYDGIVIVRAPDKSMATMRARNLTSNPKWGRKHQIQDPIVTIQKYFEDDPKWEDWHDLREINSTIDELGFFLLDEGT